MNNQNQVQKIESSISVLTGLLSFSIRSGLMYGYQSDKEKEDLPTDGYRDSYEDALRTAIGVLSNERLRITGRTYTVYARKVKK